MANSRSDLPSLKATLARLQRQSRDLRAITAEVRRVAREVDEHLQHVRTAAPGTIAGDAKAPAK